MPNQFKLLSTTLGLLISLLLLSRVNGEQRNVESLTHITNYSFYDPTVLKVHNQLIYVSYPKVNSDVIIKLESKAIADNLNNTCSIVVSVPDDRDFLAPEAKVLGNGKVVVGLIETAETEVGPYLRFFVVNLKDGCSNSNFSVAFDDELLQYYKPFTVIPYDDAFDVFIKSYLHCQPAGSICLVRFNLKGEKLRALNFNFKTNESNYDLVKLSSLIEFDPTSGYAYVSTETSTIKILDQNLRVIKQKRLPGYIRASSVLNNDVGVCYHVDENDKPRTECIKYDRRLKPKTSPSFENPGHSEAKRLYNLADGSSLLVSIARGKIDTSVKRIGLDGSVSKTVEFKYECESFLTDPADKFVELKGRIYCFSYQCKRSMITHCVPLMDLPNLNLVEH